MKTWNFSLVTVHDGFIKQTRCQLWFFVEFSRNGNKIIFKNNRL